jgi:hypothetical protein
VQRYTAAANRERLALQAAKKLKAGTKVANLSSGPTGAKGHEISTLTK